MPRPLHLPGGGPGRGSGPEQEARGGSPPPGRGRVGGKEGHPELSHLQSAHPGPSCYSLFIKMLRCRLTLFAQYLFRQP